MLLGQRFGRRHQGALAAGFDRSQQRVQRHNGLSRADVALEQPLHRNGAGQVHIELADRGLLVGRQLEGQRGAVAGDQLPRLAERGRQRALALANTTRDAELEHEQLVEREPAAAFLRLGLGARAMERMERVGAERQPFPHLELGGQRVG